MAKKITQAIGPLLALFIVAIIALFSLANPQQAEKIVHSKLFMVFGVIIAIRSLSAIITAFTNPNKIKRIANIIIHLGVMIGLTGVGINGRTKNNGYLFLETGHPGKNFYLNQSFSAINELAITISIDSITDKQVKGFEPAPIIWLQAHSEKENYAIGITYNQPYYHQGIQILFSKLTEPGFPHAYILFIDTDEYLLMHNQRVRLADKTVIYSHAYDPAEQELGLLINGQEQWLKIGESKQAGGHNFSIASADFSQKHGAVFLIKDIRFRFIISAGFGLMLCGLFIYLFDRRKV